MITANISITIKIYVSTIMPVIKPCGCPCFIPWIKGKLAKKNFDDKRPNGLLYLKGGDLAEELGPLKAQLTHLNQFFSDEFFETKKVVYLTRKEVQGFHAPKVKS